MSLRKYFQDIRGTGVLATADKNGKVNTALYARPHVFDESTVGFIMRERLSRKNLLENPYSSYLFHESGKAFRGTRMRLKMISESADSDLITKLSRRNTYDKLSASDVARYLVTFSVEKCFSLVGGDEVEL